MDANARRLAEEIKAKSAKETERLRAALQEARDSLRWIKLHSQGEVHGESMNAIERIDKALHPDGGAP
jgi:hypothetical protein